MTKKSIAVLGLGIMGNGIANNFLERDYEVNVWNRSLSKCDHLVALGAKAANSPREAAAEADVIFDVTANDESSRELFLDKDNGLFAFGTKNQIFVTCATLSIQCTDDLAKTAKQKGLTFFDMPMTGSRAGAESGNLTLFIGGDKDKFEELKSTLSAIASDLRYFGGTGSGMRFKLILNATMATHAFVFGEALNLSRAFGVDQNLAGQYLTEKPGGVVTNMAWNCFQEQPEQTQFAVKWMLKDLKYAKQMLLGSSDEYFLNPVYLDISIARLQKAFDAGLGDEDWTIANKI